MIDNKIQVLIVDDVADTRENIRKLLQFEPDIEVIGGESSGRSGIDVSKELKPDVVLMDINMPDMDGIMATEFIRRNNPFTQIVILSVQGDPNYMRRAMLAGARDFLTKPPSMDELVSAIRRAGKIAQEERLKTIAISPIGIHGVPGGISASLPLGKIILVYSPKGGTGATTLAVNLAVTLHNSEAPVALVDANLQYGDIAVFLNEQVRNNIIDLASRADELDIEVVNDVMIQHAPSGIKILAAPSRPEYAESVTGEQFGKVLTFLRRVFSYIIIDSSSTLTDVALATMDLSDLIILITSQEIPSIKNARLFLDLAESLNIERKRILLVINKYDKRIGILPEKIGESLKHDIKAVIPLEERVVIPSINRGIPFMIEDRTRPIAKSFILLVEVVRHVMTELVNEKVENNAPSTKR